MPATRRKLHAFSLIELLVVIVIIATLIGILLPALSRARLNARRLISASNLASLARSQAAYGADFKDSFVNPFDARTAELYRGTVFGNGAVPDWYCVIAPQYAQDVVVNLAFFYDRPARATEGFSATWGQYVASYLGAGDGATRYLLDPSDPAINARARRTSQSTDSIKVYDTSYWYSPVFWLGSERYASESLVYISPSRGSQSPDARKLRRNRFDQVSFPAMKAMLFERFDCSVNRRPSGQVRGTVDGFPQWNNPGAKPQVAFVDGGVSTVRMSEVHSLGESTDAAVTAQFRPSGYFNPDLNYLLYYELYNSIDTDPYETGMAPFGVSTAWRQYFYATRNGILGRDVANRK